MRTRFYTMSIEIQGLDGVFAGLDAVMQQFENDADQIVQEAGQECRDEMKARVQVRTGYTRDQIFYEGGHLESSAASPVPWSPYLEFGTRKMHPYPFAIPSFNVASEHMQDKLKKL